MANRTFSSVFVAVQSTQGILVRLTRLTDTSLIAHWITEDHGLLKTVAKGARRPKSPFAGKLDLFFSAEISIRRTGKGDLHPLGEVAIRHWREGLRKQYATTLLAAYCCQLMESALEPEHPDAEMYDLLRRALDHLNTAGASSKALFHFEKELARLLGVAHAQMPADHCLRETIGTLPATRAELIDRLAQSENSARQA